MTALSDPEDETRGFELGAVDYIAKPVSPPIVMARVRTHLSLVCLDDLIESRRQIIERLGRRRVQGQRNRPARDPHEPLCAPLALASGWSEEAAEELMAAAPCTISARSAFPMPSCSSPAP